MYFLYREEYSDVVKLVHTVAKMVILIKLWKKRYNKYCKKLAYYTS